MQPAKKSKKSSRGTAEELPAKEAPVPSAVEAPKATKKTRKRAADFLDDEPETTPPKKGKRNAKSKAEESASLTADGVNGIIEHSDDEGITITTSKSPVEDSMMAEAGRTMEQELEDAFGGVSDKGNGEEAEEIDHAPALLAGFDSDNDDLAEDKDFDASRVAPIPQFKKTSKKLRQAASRTESPGVVYVGRIPHGFYEKEMREYFSQFGTITRLRLSRNKKTGASKHFAFIEFESDEVAKIVAETMDNYLMFGHILKCKYADRESLHPEVWEGANKKFRKIPHHKLAREREEKARERLTPEKIEKKMGKERRRREKKQKQMKELGYEYELPKLVEPRANGAEEAGDDKDREEKPLAIEAPDVEGALVPPENVPKDEVAAKVEEKVKKAKRGKKADQGKVEVVATATESAAPAIESAPVRDAALPKRSQRVKTASEAGDTTKPAQSKEPKEKKPLVKAAAKSKAEPAKKEKQLKGILKKPKKA